MSTAARKERGPYARTALRREQIARASLEIVVELGHENLTTAEVARRAGSSEATALYHFPSKDHLLVAALEHQDQLDQTEAGQSPLLGFQQPGSALDLDVFRGFAQATVARGRVLRLYVALSGLAAIPGHPAEAYFRRHYDDATRAFAGIIATWQSAGSADPRLDCAVAARQVLATWDGLKLQWLVAPGFDVGEALVDAIRRLTGRDAMETQHAVLTALMQGQA